MQVLEQLVSKLLSKMPLLLRLLDNIALLDMLLAFFQAVTGVWRGCGCCAKTARAWLCVVGSQD